MFREAFDHAIVFHIDPIGSHHYALLIDCCFYEEKSIRTFRLLICKKRLLFWSKRTFLNFKKAIDQFRARLSRCTSGEQSREKLVEVEHLTRLIEEEWSNEEAYWWQRSRISWLNCGDMNTKLFHNSIIQRNKVLRLKSENGVWLEDRVQINRAFSEFYQHLFSSVGSRPMQQALSYVDEVVTAEDNARLMKVVSKQEIEETMF
ncbi:hypothetical protein K1719_044214 [Acacia pycnantha]|nr:hypothetical protein K1719_044214 [Acacia pycnantha]